MSKLNTLSEGLSVNDIVQAARLLEQGDLVAFPTETVYGLGADAENASAVAKIYQAKGRPADHPVIVHLAQASDPGYWVTALPSVAQDLIDAFWPGPLTLILPRAAHIPSAVSGGQDTVGLRCPSHPIAQQLLQEFKGGRGGVAAPSANKFGRISPTTAQHVRAEFSLPDGSLEPLLQMILDGGQSEVGIESTILDLSRLDYLGPVLLRPGHISAEQLAPYLGQLPHAPDADAPRASGTLAAHYAPHTPLVIVEGAQLLATKAQLHAIGKTVAVLSHTVLVPGDEHHCLHLPAKAAPYAHGLYSALRQLDQLQTDIILLETPPQSHTWHGVNDRLKRAAHDSVGKLAALLSK